MTYRIAYVSSMGRRIYCVSCFSQFDVKCFALRIAAAEPLYLEVVEAIEKLDDFYVQIEENACYIYDISKFDNEQTNAFIKVDINTTSKKEAVVQAINQFLIWYNENN